LHERHASPHEDSQQIPSTQCLLSQLWSPEHGLPRGPDPPPSAAGTQVWISSEQTWPEGQVSLLSQ
jgi:hypothetical protein